MLVHVIEGRLRVRVPQLKGVPDGASELEHGLRTLTGITHVTANPLTGSVLILYDTEETTIEEITDALRTRGYLSEAAAPSHGYGPGGGGFGNLMLRATAEFALQQIFTALI